MFYVYVLRSASDGNLYTGCTRDLRNRFALHKAGKVPSTKERRPLDLIYYEACLNEQDAFRREKCLKTTYGKRYLKVRCRNYFTG
jgi:putative endonuclease